MSELVKPDELDEGIVLGWSMGRDPESKARAYLARWIPLLPGSRSGKDLPVYTTIYEARIRPNSRLALLSLILAGPLAGLVGDVLPEGRYIGLGVVAIGLSIGAIWWRRAPSIWQRGAFVRLLGERLPGAAAERPVIPAAQDIPLLSPPDPPAPVSMPPAPVPHGTPPPSIEPLVEPDLATQEPLAATLQAGPAVPRSPISHSPDWATSQPAPVLKTPPWAPADIPLPSATKPASGTGGDAGLPVWPGASQHPMASSFDTLVGASETKPPIEPTRRPALNAELSVEAGPDAGRTFRAGDSSVRVGRAPDNDLVLVDPRTSRHHAQIELRGEQFWVVDLSSANGTVVNGERVSERSLHNGDVIRIGQNTMSFRFVNPELSLI